MKRITFISFSILILQICCSITPRESINHKNFVWNIDSSKHFYYYYESGTLAQDRINYLKEKSESDLSEVLKQIDSSEYNSVIYYFFLPSLERMVTLIDHKTNACAFPRHNSLYAVYNDKIKAIGKHELNHLIVHNMWGSPSEKWLSEGFAVFSDNKWHGEDLFELTKYLFEKGKLLPITEVIHSFSSYSPMIKYPESGSFFKYLHETYGIADIKSLWEGDSFEDVYGKTIEQLESEWLQIIKSISSKNVDYDI